MVKQLITEVLIATPTLANSVDEISCNIQLPERQLIVIPVVEHIEQVCIEGVYVIHFWEILQNFCEGLMPCCLCVLDLPHVELAYPRDLPSLVADGRRLALGSGQNCIHECLRRRNHLDLFEIVQHHLCCTKPPKLPRQGNEVFQHPN